MKVYEKTYVIFALLILAVVSILFWTSITRINDFKEYNYLIGQESVRNVSESISQFMRERKRLIQIFANEHKQLIQRSALSPDDEQIKDVLDSEVEKYFPEYFTYTVTDKFGEPYFIDFDGLIGDLCLADIRIFSTKNIANPRVHPHSEMYHYDLLASFNVSNKDYIFFISFPADEISSYLKSTQVVGHKTMLVLKNLENLIEITTDGARNKNFREDYRLTGNELSYLLSENPVTGTSWTVYDMQESNLFSAYKNKIIIENVAIFLIFILVGIILFSLVKKEEKKRKKAEAIKSEFVTVVSHELRTPLTSVSGAIKLIENEVLGPVNDNIKNYLNIASNNIDRLTNIINDILDIKKMETGEFQLYRENISLVGVVEQAVKENFTYARTFNVEFDFVKPDKDYIVYGDKDRLLQVMANLLSNAVKYGAKQDRVKIYFKELSKSIQLNIEDHGKGIKEENKERLFEKFTQYHSRATEVVKGTGLGLSIVKNIIENHGGSVSFEKGEEKGTVFYILLPLVL